MFQYCHSAGSCVIFNVETYLQAKVIAKKISQFSAGYLLLV